MKPEAIHPVPQLRPAAISVRQPAHAPVEISVVAPVHNEAPGLAEFFARLIPVLDGLGTSYEIICVDDGSSDDSLERLLELREPIPALKVLSLSRNFGKDVAVSAGFDYARGAAVVPIDAELQDSPELIGRMVAKWREGYDVVYATRGRRAGESWFRRITARYFYRVLDRITDIPIPHDTGDFRLLDRRVVDVLVRLPERTRFMKGLFAWVGFKQVELLAAVEFCARCHHVVQLASAQGLELCRLRDRALFVSVRGFSRRSENNSRRRRPRLYIADGGGAVLRRRATYHARHHRRVHGAHVQRSEGPSALPRARRLGLRRPVARDGPATLSADGRGRRYALVVRLAPRDLRAHDRAAQLATLRRDSRARLRHGRKFRDAGASRQALRDGFRRNGATLRGLTRDGRTRSRPSPGSHPVR